MARDLSTPVLRYVIRNLHFWDGNGRYLGGLWQDERNAHITNADFYDFIKLACDFNPQNTQWAIWKAKEDGSTGARLPSTRSLLVPGRYLILGNDGEYVNVQSSPERPIRRVATQQRSTRRLSSQQLHFRDTLRTRDNACAISGVRVGRNRNFKDKEASHIFPVAKLQLWNLGGRRNVITDTRPSAQISPSKIDSVQNGLLLDTSIHRLFDSFIIGMNPDRDYKVISFEEDTHELGGRKLAQSAWAPSNPQDKVSDELLRWHFQQCVLTNIKGAGEPKWEEDDFGEQNEIAQIMELGGGPSRMEEELFNRLGTYMEVSA